LSLLPEIIYRLDNRAKAERNPGEKNKADRQMVCTEQKAGFDVKTHLIGKIHKIVIARSPAFGRAT
jgi:hypothetical protein